jgi:acyl-coenzyme A thioesterase PaaI-like protein
MFLHRSRLATSAAAAAAAAVGLGGTAALVAHAQRRADDDTWNQLDVKYRKPNAIAIDTTPETLYKKHPRHDAQFVWQTLQGERMLRRKALWRWSDTNVVSTEGSSSSVPGRARFGLLVEIGDTLNGHVGLVHGGLSATIVDDVLGWCAVQERREQGLPEDAKLFTANLNVNYRKPMHDNSVYFVEVKTERIEKKKKLWMTAKVIDAVSGETAVDATSLYIIKLPPT